MKTTQKKSEKWSESQAFNEQLSASELATYERIQDNVDFVDNDLFHQADAEKRLFGPDAMKIEIPIWSSFSDDPEELPLVKGRKAKLTGAEEIELFLRYNYARYRLSKLVQTQQKRKSLIRARQMAIWQHRLMEARAALTCANMALVLAMAKRTRIPNVEFAELVSEGNMALLRSIEKFDVSRGFKLSTYACRAILKSFNRMATKTGKYRQYFPTEYDPDLERSDYDVMKHDIQRDDSVDSLRQILAENSAKLTETERIVVFERFAIGSEGRGRTLAQVGQMVGLTNERVRQIQKHALTKLRGVLDGQLVA